MKQCLAAGLLILVVDWVYASQSDIEYSNIWEAEINGGEETAKRVAEDLGYTYHGKLKSFDNRYVVTKDNIPEQSMYKSDHVTKELEDLEEKLSVGLYVIRGIKNISDTMTAKTTYFALSESHLHYGISVWGATTAGNLQQVTWARQHIVPRRMEDPEASTYLRRLCSVIDPPIKSDASTVSAQEGSESSKPPSRRPPIRLNPISLFKLKPEEHSPSPQISDGNQNFPQSEMSDGGAVTSSYSHPPNSDISSSFSSSYSRPPSSDISSSFTSSYSRPPNSDTSSSFTSSYSRPPSSFFSHPLHSGTSSTSYYSSSPSAHRPPLKLPANLYQPKPDDTPPDEEDFFNKFQSMMSGLGALESNRFPN